MKILINSKPYEVSAEVYEYIQKLREDKARTVTSKAYSVEALEKCRKELKEYRGYKGKPIKTVPEKIVSVTIDNVRYPIPEEVRVHIDEVRKEKNFVKVQLLQVRKSRDEWKRKVVARGIK